MDLEERLELIRRGVSEIVTIDELRRVLETGEPKGYLGFEPSGLFHVGWLVWAFKFKDLIDAGVKMYLLAATWHAWINDKFEGDMKLIKSSANHVVKVLNLLGLEGRFKLVYADELVSSSMYWERLLKVAKAVSLARVKRALTIMGRRLEEGEADFSKLIYPLMQVTDIFMLDLDIALGGMDQRKAHMLQRDVAEKLGWKKAVAIHTPLIPALQGGGRMDFMKGDEVRAEFKMSKSRPETAIFLVDSDEVVRSKLRRAYCPPRTSEDNPVMEMFKNIVFRGREVEVVINRPSKYGGPITVNSYDELKKLYENGLIHPLDLKNALAEELINIISPIRKELLRDKDTLELIKWFESRLGNSS